MADLTDLLADLAAESADLDALVSPLPPADWARPTPAPRWTIAHQIAHLAWTDQVAVLAATDAEAFFAAAAAIATDPDSYVDRAAEDFLAPPPDLLARWRAGRTALAEALRAVPAGTKLPWYGTRMSPMSMVTARLMETWAHGQDVADTLGVTRTPTARLRHVAYLGFRTLGYSFAAHGRPEPVVPIRVDLAAPASARSELASPAVASE
ncbi:MAG TPA: maleylpyruvate isomerase family mycothiol-dependent enzyme, partial [Micromonosporaceae bacterium]